MDRIAVVKIGARITINNSSTSAGTGDAVNVINLLAGAGFTVDAYTTILEKDEIPKNFNLVDINTEYTAINDKGYTALVVLNGNANFFGGAEDRNVLLTYNIINNFKGKVYYIITDPALTLKQIWKSVSNKPWGNKYNENDVNITRNDIDIITQIADLKAAKSLNEKNNIYINDVHYFPFEKYHLYTSDALSVSDQFDYDISYGGTFRSGRREDDLIKFYFGYPDDIKVEIFGKIAEKDFKPDKIKNLSKPIFNKAIKYTEFRNKMNKSIATIIVGDTIYKKIDFMAQRIYECIQAGNILFIDKSYDKNMRVFTDKNLRDICYVNDRKDVIERIHEIKHNTSIIKQIVEAQRKDVKIDFDEYLSNLATILKG